MKSRAAWLKNYLVFTFESVVTICTWMAMNTLFIRGMLAGRHAYWALSLLTFRHQAVHSGFLVMSSLDLGTQSLILERIGSVLRSRFLDGEQIEMQNRPTNLWFLELSL